MKCICCELHMNDLNEDNVCPSCSDAYGCKPLCPFCTDTRINVEKIEFDGGENVTSYDPDNGPVYYAECELCLGRGPICGWAADAIGLFVNVGTYVEYTEKQENIHFKKLGD